jgi:protein NrfC
MAGEKNPVADKAGKKKFSRRDFVVGGGTVIAGGALAVYTPKAASARPAATKKPSGYPLSQRYLVYDSRHCEGCMSCMFACSMVHEGVSSLSLSRIQVSRAILTKYPLDIQINVCRQCPEPMCVQNCPTGACHISAENANVRMIDSEKCLGCGTCLKSCPHTPHRTIWNPVLNKSTKCDLCVNTPYFQKKGGPLNSQACVSTCPAGALKLVAELPSQEDTSGYDLLFAPPPARGAITSAAKPEPSAPAKKE